MKYDIIGDIHGHADELEVLLQKLGYKLSSGIYKHENERQVVFVGDYIDRGPKIRETLHIVKNMCDHGSAFAIMGNHEFNAVCFHTPDIKKGGYFRKHSIKEIKQHFETLIQFEKFPDEWVQFLNWFKTLPLFGEFDGFRVIHACWVQKHIDWMKVNYKGLTNEFISQASNKNTVEYKIIEDSLKGIEIKIPNGFTFKDKDGTTRSECRLKWWQPIEKRKQNKDILILCPSEVEHLPVSNNGELVYKSETPVFFGHYWLEGKPSIENPLAICLDYSVAKEGKLMAYKSEHLYSNNKSGGFVY